MSAWYQLIRKSKVLEQGDIISRCLIPVPTKGVYQSVLDGTGEADIDIREADIIVLSQSCDLENDKIESVILCPIWPLKALVEKNPHFKSSDAKESLRQGKEPAYHLLDDHTEAQTSLPISVVDFHQIHALPKAYLEAIAEKSDQRLRLLSPYKEHLSQAFARYFMRVGLPQNIDKAKIKQIA